MANYTITLQALVQANFKIFDETWETFIKDHKTELCNKIIRHYWFYEIGQETPERFKHYINEHLARIMPYYNQLYASELLKIEPVFDRYMEETIGIKRDKGRKRSTTSAEDVSRIRDMAESIKKMTEGTRDSTGNKKTIGHEEWKEDRTIHTVEVTDQDTTENTKKDVTYNEEVTKKKVENMKDVIDGTKEIDTDTTTDRKTDVTTSNTRRYSDTPQAVISADGMAIEQSYLTNYTRDNGTSNTVENIHEVGHSTEKVHTDETRDTTTDETDKKESTEGTIQEVKGTNDVNKTTDTSDKLVGSKDRTEGVDTTENIKNTGIDREFSNGTESDRQRQSSVGSEEINDAEREDTKTIQRGFTVSQAELLKLYRSTFLNIDEKIIEELATNFMGIY